MATVGIFRLQLFKPSETFIVNQVKELTRYAPVFVGRTVAGDGKGVRAITPPVARSRFGRASQFVRRVGLRDPTDYVDALEGAVPDLLHCHFAVDGVYAAQLSTRLKIPLVTTLHGFDVTRSDADMLRSGRPALINGVLFRRQLFARGALFVCVSEFLRTAAIQRGFPEDKLRVHYIGIDTQGLQPRQGAGEDGLIVHVARLVEKKGTRYLLQAVAKIAPEQPDVRLVIIGDGPLRRALEHETRALGIADRVQFLGTQPNSEVLRWDARAAIKAVPSVTAPNGDKEAFGIVNLEAAALGVPVVGFRTGGVGEAVVQGETGFLLPEADVEGLAHHLSMLLSNRELRQRMGAAARTRAEAEFDISRQTRKLESIYDEAREMSA